MSTAVQAQLHPSHRKLYEQVQGKYNADSEAMDQLSTQTSESIQLWQRQREILSNVALAEKVTPLHLKQFRKGVDNTICQMNELQKKVHAIFRASTHALAQFRNAPQLSNSQTSELYLDVLGEMQRYRDKARAAYTQLNELLPKMQAEKQELLDAVAVCEKRLGIEEAEWLETFDLIGDSQTEEEKDRIQQKREKSARMQQKREKNAWIDLSDEMGAEDLDVLGNGCNIDAGDADISGNEEAAEEEDSPAAQLS